MMKQTTSQIKIKKGLKLMKRRRNGVRKMEKMENRKAETKTLENY